MQHDTSLYTLEIGPKRLKVIGSLLYSRYSKIRYLKFYRVFNRFKMKCFFHEGLTFFGGMPLNTVLLITPIWRGFVEPAKTP